MPLPALDGKYTQGRRRQRLFRRSRRRFLPVSLIVMGVFLLILWLIPVPQIEPVLPIDPQTLPTNTPVPTSTPTPTPTSIYARFGGRIVFTCTRQEINQICAINADGSDFVQITDGFRHSYYPTFSPDMSAIVFARNEGDYFDLFRYQLADGSLQRLTTYIGNAFSPKFSPDGSRILFLNRVRNEPTAIWIMGPLGEDPRPFYRGEGNIVGIAWSPDGHTIAFAMATTQANAYEIYLLDADHPERPPRRLTYAVEGATGSLAWSPDGRFLLVCLGPPGDKNLFHLELATGNAYPLTFGGNNASAAYSPDGESIVFNSLRNGGQADLFTIRTNGHSTRLLFDHPEPDWQPQWGP